jgi:N-acetyl-alpha-D-muramate 1-phosphate uridylyltransferase
MILAAGRGERMRPLTDTMPKPLLMAGNKRLIEWQIESLVRAGVQRIVINHAWQGAQFEMLLGRGHRYGCELVYSPETRALETAGGIANALPLLGDACFIVVSGDIYTHFDYTRLATHAENLSAHLILVPNPDYHLQGDMGLDAGLIVHGMPHQFTYTYANIGVFNPALFKSLDPTEPKKLFPWLYRQGALTGELFQGTWHNVGTPQQLHALHSSLSPIT